jgi:hypothetical protein
MTIANRAIGAPFNIWNDHSDSMALRTAGVVQATDPRCVRRSWLVTESGASSFYFSVMKAGLPMKKGRCQRINHAVGNDKCMGPLCEFAASVMSSWRG